MSTAALTFVVVAGYLTTAALLALALGRMIALRDRQVTRDRPEDRR